MASLNCHLTCIHLNSFIWEKNKPKQDIIHKPCESLCFYLIAKKLRDSQSSWWHRRRGTDFCLGGWPQGRCLQVMLLHGVEVGICWLNVPLTCRVRVWAWCNFQGMARASSLSSTGVVQLPRQHLDISQVRWDSSGNKSCTVTFPYHGRPRKWAPHMIFERKHLQFLISMSALRAVLYLINFGS